METKNCTEWDAAEAGKLNWSCPPNEFDPYVVLRIVFAVPTLELKVVSYAVPVA